MTGDTGRTPYQSLIPGSMFMPILEAPVHHLAGAVLMGSGLGVQIHKAFVFASSQSDAAKPGISSRHIFQEYLQ
jgi:hypothetical protein